MKYTKGLKLVNNITIIATGVFFVMLFIALKKQLLLSSFVCLILGVTFLLLAVMTKYHIINLTCLDRLIQQTTAIENKIGAKK